MNTPIPKMAALLMAQEFATLCATQVKARERKRKPLRLPPETWEKITNLASQLQSAFPNRYVTVNSTLEFIIDQGLKSILTDGSRLRSRPIPMDNDDVKLASGE